MPWFTPKTKCGSWKTEDWYLHLDDNRKYVFDLINKYHEYFSIKDKLYRRVVRCLKILLLFLAMASTIVLGLKNVIPTEIQVPTGLVLSAIIAFLTAISSYFNFEEYWMRNISIHIELNIIRDNFIYDAKSLSLSQEIVDGYKNRIEQMQRENIKYWEKAIKRI